MPRGGGSRGGRASPSPSRNTTTYQAPPRNQPINKPVQQQAPQVQQAAPVQQGGMFSGIGGAIVSGMAMGTGMELGRQAVRGLMGGNGQSETQSQESSQNVKCQYEGESLQNCLKNNSNIADCQSYMDVLKQCQQNQY